MKLIRLLFKNTKNIVTISIEEISRECVGKPTEVEILQTLKEMERENEIAIVPPRKEY